MASMSNHHSNNNNVSSKQDTALYSLQTAMQQHCSQTHSTPGGYSPQCNTASQAPPTTTTTMAMTKKKTNCNPLSIAFLVGSSSSQASERQVTEDQSITEQTSRTIAQDPVPDECLTAEATATAAATVAAAWAHQHNSSLVNVGALVESIKLNILTMEERRLQSDKGKIKSVQNYNIKKVLCSKFDRLINVI